MLEARPFERLVKLLMPLMCKQGSGPRRNGVVLNRPAERQPFRPTSPRSRDAQLGRGWGNFRVVDHAGVARRPGETGRQLARFCALDFTGVSKSSGCSDF